MPDEQTLETGGSNSASPARAHISARFGQEFERQSLLKSLSAGLLIYFLEVIVVISFTALVFSGPLSGQVPRALGLIIAGDALVCLLVALFSSYPGSIAIEQDAPAAVMALAAAAIAAAVPAGLVETRGFATVLMGIIVTTVFTGLFFMLLGWFRLGGLVRFLPYPVMGGFLAGTGWLLVTGGIGVMAGTTGLQALMAPELLLRWLPGVLLGVLMAFLVERTRSPLALPAAFATGTLGFYLVAWLMRQPFAAVEAGGWLLGPFQSGGAWRFPLSAEMLSQVDWSLIAANLPALLPVLIVSVIALLLNANGLELIVRRDMDLNRELLSAGAASIVSGMVGGLVGFHSISLSSLNHTMSGGRRLAGVTVAVLLAVTVFAGVSFLSFLPRLVLGALLVYLGVSMLYEWVYQAWFRFPKLDFAIILAILAIIAVGSFLVGIGVGLVLTVILFVISYSQVDVVAQSFTAALHHSRVTRDLQQRQMIAEHGDEIYVMKLRGYIFFGTAHNLLERVKAVVEAAEETPVRTMLLDFSHATGLDSTGLLSFQKLLQFAGERGLVVVLTGLHPRVADQFERGGFHEQEGLLRIFSDLDYGLEWSEEELLRRLAAGMALAGPLTGQFESIVSSPQKVADLMAHMLRREVAAGEVLIQQGDPPDWIYLIESGQFTVQIERPGSAPLRIETMYGGRTVGELGFYLGIARTADVLADTPGVVYCLSKEMLHQMERQDPEAAQTFHRIVIHLIGERVVHLTRVVEALQH